MNPNPITKRTSPRISGSGTFVVRDFVGGLSAAMMA
jgi:hypothetical protein